MTDDGDTHNVTVYRVPKELATDDSHTAGDGQGHGPLIEQLEGEVVNGDLGNEDKIEDCVRCVNNIKVKLPLRCRGQPLWRSWWCRLWRPSLIKITCVRIKFSCYTWISWQKSKLIEQLFSLYSVPGAFPCPRLWGNIIFIQRWPANTALHCTVHKQWKWVYKVP